MLAEIPSSLGLKPPSFRWSSYPSIINTKTGIPRSSWHRGVHDRLEGSVDSARPFSTCSISVLVIAPRRYFCLERVWRNMENPITNWNNYINSIFEPTNFYIEYLDMLPLIFMSLYIYIYIHRFPCPPFKLQTRLFLHVSRGTVLLPWKLGRSSRRSRRRSWICPDAGGAHTTPVWESAGCWVEDASWWRRHVSWESKISKGPNPPNGNLPMLFAPRKKDLFGRGLWSPPWFTLDIAAAL